MQKLLPELLAFQAVALITPLYYYGGADGPLPHLNPLTRYLKWTDSGMVLAVGCGVRSDIERSQFPQDAYQLGLSLKQHK